MGIAVGRRRLVVDALRAPSRRKLCARSPRSAAHIFTTRQWHPVTRVGEPSTRIVERLQGERAQSMSTARIWRCSADVRHTELLNQKFVSCLSRSHKDEMRFRRAGPALSFDGRCIQAVPNLGSHAGVATTVAGPCPFTKTQRLNFREERSNNNQIVGDLFEGYGSISRTRQSPLGNNYFCAVNRFSLP